MKLEEVRDECTRCYYLKPLNITMRGDYDYCCRKRPRTFLNKDRKEQCDKFKDADEVFIAREVDEWRSPE
jgi:hypothetical protein